MGDGVDGGDVEGEETRMRGRVVYSMGGGAANMQGGASRQRALC